jgi:calcineurin-like phosphoesterase family protein
MIFFTADMHLGDTNEKLLAHRPFKNVTEMNKKLIANWNAKVGPDDTVYHLGDFCRTRKGDPSFSDYEKKLNGKIVFIQGNHDGQAKLYCLIKYAFLRSKKLLIMLQHKPPVINEDGIVKAFNANCNTSPCNLMLCGHIHEKWKHLIVKRRSGGPFMVMNVGVDAWDFTPLGLDEIKSYQQSIIELKSVKSNKPKPKPKPKPKVTKPQGPGRKKLKAVLRMVKQRSKEAPRVPPVVIHKSNNYTKRKREMELTNEQVV